MFTFILLAILAVTVVLSIFRPWLGVCAYYVLAILSPQYIWPWIFGDIRATLIVSVSVIAGLCFKVFADPSLLKRLKNTQIIFVMVIWAFTQLSNIFSPYVYGQDFSGIVPPHFIIDIFNTIVIFFILACLLIDSEKKLMFFTMVIIFSGLYLIFWANSAYLTGFMWKHQVDGRLMGPGGIYTDTNAFATLFVVVQPFLFYGAFIFRNRLFKSILWLSIPFLWHGIFLTGSRGGLLALFAMSCFMAFRMKSKRVGAALIVCLAIALITQGGQILDRTEKTIEKQESIAEGEKLDPRLESWRIGFEIIIDRPVFGVGPGRFQVAAPNYDGSDSYVAHNTFLQFSTGSGLGAGLLYLLLFWNEFKSKRRFCLHVHERVAINNIEFIHEAGVTALIGFFVSSLFLDLMLFEPFYYLLALLVVTKAIKKHSSNEASNLKDL
ncbi:hypothetical protein C9993_04760 [Marinobacter sp. Z-F4-2]|nr:hypothetical protein C9993_04760 [Marinobacter sp. Z-F4-2]